MRSPLSVFVDSTFLPIVPERNPRTLWGCQSVAFMISFKLAPPARFSRSRTFSVLLPWRAPVAFGPAWRFLAPFFAGVACFPDFAFDGATRGFRGATLAFVVAFGSPAVAVAWADS
jgi:hypothetical protein